MADPTPPPERPLPEEARARIRAELLAQRPGGRRWAVPVAAAAAVAVVAGTAYWAVGLGGDGESPTPAATEPGASSIPSAPTPSTPAPSAPPAATPPATPSATPPATPSATASQVGTGSCEVELENVLRGAQEVFGVDGLSYWVKGQRYSLCYQAEGTTTVTQPLLLTPAVQRAESYRVASLYPPTATGFRTVRVAGGVVPDGAAPFDVAYTFPDGHTEHAALGTDAQGRSWWRMVYSYDAGGGNETKSPPIAVTVTSGDFDYSFTLEWGVDTCAQANHGC